MAECSAGNEGRNFCVYLQRLATLFRRNTAVGNACRNFTVLHFSNAESHTAFINATFRRGFGCLVYARSDKFAAAYVYRSATNFYGDFSANNTARKVQRAVFRREVDCRTVCMRYTAAYNVDCCSATHSACFVRLDCGEQPVGRQHCRCVDDGFAVGVHAVFTCSNRESVCKRYRAFGIGFHCKRRNADDIGVCIAFSNNGTVGNFHRYFAAVFRSANGNYTARFTRESVSSQIQRKRFGNRNIFRCVFKQCYCCAVWCGIYSRLQRVAIGNIFADRNGRNCIVLSHLGGKRKVADAHKTERQQQRGNYREKCHRQLSDFAHMPVLLFVYLFMIG